MPFRRRTRAGSMELEVLQLGSVKAVDQERKERALEEHSTEASLPGKRPCCLKLWARVIGLTCLPTQEYQQPGRCRWLFGKKI